MKKSVTVLALVLGFSIANATSINFESNFDAPKIMSYAETVSPLCKAAAIGDIDRVKLLINNGVDVNAKSNGMLPIHYAAKFNRVEVIKVLINAGSKVHSQCDKGLTALKHAKKTNATEAEQFLKRFKNKDA